MDGGKVLLRNTRTKMWYAGPDLWVAAPAGACEFATVQQAAAFGHGLGVKGMEVVVHYHTGEGDLVLPLREKTQ